MTPSLILVADAAHARILTNHLDGLTVVDEFQHPSGRAHGRDLVTDRPGRTRTDSGARAAMEPQTDPVSVERDHFAHQLGDVVVRRSREYPRRRLMLVAPPEMLGLLRRHLRGVDTVDVPKDYSDLTLRELDEALAPHLG